MFIIEIPITLIIIFALCAIGLGWSIISNIEEILETIGIGIVTTILVLIFLFLIYLICNLICRKRTGPTVILFILSLFLMLQGIFTYTSYMFDRYDAFYTIDQVTLQGVTKDGESIVCTIPPGSLISEVDRNTEFKAYTGGIESVPTTRECKYKTENGTVVIVHVEKSNMTACGWVDCFDKHHKE